MLPTRLLVRALTVEVVALLTVVCEGRPPPGQSETVFFREPTITSLAEKLGLTPAQIVLSWGVQRGTVVIPKSENDERMKANITVRW